MLEVKDFERHHELGLAGERRPISVWYLPSFTTATCLVSFLSFFFLRHRGTVSVFSNETLENILLNKTGGF